MMPDHIHILLTVPPKYSVSQVVGFMKSKSAMWIARTIDRKSRNFTGANFWARGYFVSTVGRDEELIRRYIRDQEIKDKQFDQQRMDDQIIQRCARVLSDRDMLDLNKAISHLPGWMADTLHKIQQAKHG